MQAFQSLLRKLEQKQLLQLNSEHQIIILTVSQRALWTCLDRLLLHTNAVATLFHQAIQLKDITWFKVLWETSVKETHSFNHSYFLSRAIMSILFLTDTRHFYVVRNGEVCHFSSFSKAAFKEFCEIMNVFEWYCKLHRLKRLHL